MSKYYLTEENLRTFIRQIIKESFEDDRLKQAIQTHGGLRRVKDSNADGYAHRYTGNMIFTHDARTSNPDQGLLDLTQAKYQGYLSEDDLYDKKDELKELGPEKYGEAAEEFMNHILFTKDRGAIVIDYSNDYNTQLKRRRRSDFDLPDDEKQSHLHLSSDDRDRLLNDKKPSFGVPVEFGARNNVGKRSGLVRNESKEAKLNRIIREAITEALKDSIQ